MPNDFERLALEINARFEAEFALLTMRGEIARVRAEQTAPDFDGKADARFGARSRARADAEFIARKQRARRSRPTKE